MRKGVDVDSDFFQKFWIQIDPFDATKGQADYEMFKKYMKIIKDEPTLFLPQNNLEISREEARILCHK
jgi:hypothetical protein